MHLGGFLHATFSSTPMLIQFMYSQSFSYGFPPSVVLLLNGLGYVLLLVLLICLYLVAQGTNTKCSRALKANAQLIWERSVIGGQISAK